VQIPPEGSICLFSPALELIPKSFGEPGETVAKAIARLKPKFKSLLAARIVKMTLNAESSRLKLGVTMNLVGQEGQIIGQAFTPRGCEEPTSCPPLGSRGSEQQLTQQLPIGSSLQFRVSNGEHNPLYVGIVLIDPAEGLVVLFPNDYQTASDKQSEETTRIEPNKTLVIPDPNKHGFELTPQEPGVGEVLVIASQKPLTNALLRLQSLADKPGRKRGEPVATRGDEAVNVVSDLLDDLSDKRSSLIKVRPISVSQMAAVSLTFEVVKNT
jgi:hypothetical protein